MKKHIGLILYIVTIILIVLGISYIASGVVGSITTFTNGLSTENITLIGNQNITRWLPVPRYGYILNATIGILKQNNIYNINNFSDGTTAKNLTWGNERNQSTWLYGTNFSDNNATYDYTGKNIVIKKGSDINFTTTAVKMRPSQPAANFTAVQILNVTGVVFNDLGKTDICIAYDYYTLNTAVFTSGTTSAGAYKIHRIGGSNPITINAEVPSVEYTLTLNRAIALNGWNNIIVCFYPSIGNYVVYQNGTYDKDRNFSTASLTPSENGYIFGGSGAPSFSGLMQDMCIFNVTNNPLTANEALYIYNNGCKAFRDSLTTKNELQNGESNYVNISIPRYSNIVSSGITLDFFEYYDSNIQNLSVMLDGKNLYGNISGINMTTQFTINLNNNSALQNCINTCTNPSGNNCICEINTTSATPGILQLSNLNMTYGFNITQNESIYLAGAKQWNNSGYNNLSQNISLNTTLINSILSSNCNCTNCSVSGSNCNIPVTFHSDTTGTLNYNSLFSNYTYGVGECSSPLWNYTILNITYGDEYTLANISAANSYELFVSSPFTQSLSNILTTSDSHSFCTNVNATARGYNISIYGTITATNPIYETRIIENDLANAYPTQTAPYYPLTIYLVSSGNASEVTFTVKDNTLKTLISDVQVQMYRLYNGTLLLSEQKLTDVTGKVKFTYIENDLYTAIFSKDGYATLSYDFHPFTSTSYDVYLVKNTILNTTQTFDRTTISWIPQQWYANVNNFAITFYNPYGELNTYSYIIEAPLANYSGNGFEAQGETLSATINLSGTPMWQRLKLTWTYNTDIAGTRSQIYYYDILNATPANYTWMAIKDNTYGLGLFERLFVGVLILLLIVGIAALSSHVDAGLYIGFSVMGLLAYSGFIPKWSIILSIFVLVILLAGEK